MRSHLTIILTFLISAILCCCKEKQTPQAETDFCSSIHRNDTISLTKELALLNELNQGKTGVHVLEDGSGSMVARAWLSEYAEKTIDIQYFIFSTDNVGLIACDYLVRAADRGVKVRILVDDIMVDAEPQDITAFNAHENITVKIYNPGVNLGKNLFQKIGKFSTDFKNANQRMHNKTFLVDDQVVITGGRNIANEYFDYDHEYNFRDRDILLIGNECKEVKKSFESFWNHELAVEVTAVVKNKSTKNLEEKTYHTLHEYACNPENFWPQVRTRIENLPATFHKITKSGQLVWLDSVSFISDIPGKNLAKKGFYGGGVTTSALMDLVNSAHTSVTIQTPYLITTKLSQNLFKEAIERGVEVTILTNSLASTDNVEAFSSYQKDRKKLLELGIHIYEMKPDAAIRKKLMTGELQADLDYQPIFGLHAKSMVVDGYKTVIGTFNLDPRSANLNTECIVIVHDERIATGVLKGMNEELKPENAWEITTDFNPDAEVGNYKRLKTWTRKIIPKGIL